MITPNLAEKNLRLNRKQITALAYQTAATTICKQLHGDTPQDCHLAFLPRVFEQRELISNLSQKPIQIDGEQLFFLTIQDDVILLQNDYNKRITRAALMMWPERRIMVLTAVSSDLRKGQYKEICQQLMTQIIDDQRQRENSVVFNRAKVGYFQRITSRKPNQLLCVALARIDTQKTDAYDQLALPLLKQVNEIAMAYADCYTAFAFDGLNKGNFDDMQKVYFYLDKINILDSSDENLENCYPNKDLFEIFIFNQNDEEVSRFSVRDKTDLKKLNVELHQQLVKVSFIKPVSEQMKYFDLSDEKRVSIDGYAFNFVQRFAKYQKQMSVLLTSVTDQDQLKLISQIAKQYQIYVIVTTNDDPAHFKNQNIIPRVPDMLIHAPFVYSDSHVFYLIKSFSEVIEHSRQHLQLVQSQNDETQDELEPDEALEPELSYQNNSVLFRGYNLSFIQRHSVIKEGQFTAVFYLDSNSLAFEQQLEQVYCFGVKCPEIYCMVVIRGVENELYLKQKMTKTIFLNKMNILAYKSGFVKFIRKCEPLLSSVCFIYDEKCRLYGQPMDVPSCLKNYKLILEDLTNQPLYNERKQVKTFFANTPGTNQYVFRGQTLKIISLAKPYLNQALISLYFIQAPKNSKNELIVQEILYDLNNALDVQKTGKSFVMVCVEGLTSSNFHKYIQQLPMLRSLNIISDKEAVAKIRFVNQMNQTNNFYFIVNQLKNSDQGYSVSSMVKYNIDRDDDADCFMQDEANHAENVIYNDLVFSYLQKVHTKTQDQSQCLIYLSSDDIAKLANNVQKVVAIQDKYPEVKIDIVLKNVTQANYNQMNFERVFYFPQINIVTDTPDSQSSIMQRDEFSYYLYDTNFELFNHHAGLTQLDADIKTVFRILQPRESIYDSDITENDKSLIIKGFYVPYLRRVYAKSKVKQLVLVYLDADDDRMTSYLKQLDEIQHRFTEIYMVIMIKQLSKYDYVDYLESKPILNKFNIVENRYMIADKVFANQPGKTIIISFTETYNDIQKFQQNLSLKFNDKKVMPPNEIFLNSRRLEFIQQVYEKHRKQIILICYIPKDEMTVGRIQQLYSLQVVYPEVYFVYYIENTDIVSIQSYKQNVYKFSQLNIIKKLTTSGVGLQFQLLDQKGAEKIKMNTIQHLTQELKNLQLDIHQNRRLLVSSLDCKLDDRINYYGQSLDYYKKNYKNEDQNVGIVFTVLDSKHPDFLTDIEKLGQLRKEQRLKFYYFLISLRNMTFEETKDVIGNNRMLAEFNIVQCPQDSLIMGTQEYRFEVHQHTQFLDSHVKVFKSVEEVGIELNGEFINEDEDSEEECYLDQDRKSEFYVDSNESNSLIFRGVRLQMLQTLEKYKHGDRTCFVYINNIDDEVSFEQRLAVVYEMQVAYLSHFFVVCVRGISNSVDIQKQQKAFYLKKLNIVSYRSGMSKLFTQTEKDKKLCAFYFSPDKDTKEGKLFIQRPLDELIINTQKQAYKQDIELDQMNDNYIVVNGFKHEYINKVQEYILKYRYVVVIYAQLEGLKQSYQQLIELSQQRDDVYVVICVDSVSTKTQLQVKAVATELNVLDDNHDICHKNLLWFEPDFAAYQQKLKEAAELDKKKAQAYRQRESKIKETKDEAALKQFVEEFGEIPSYKEFKPRKNNLVCLTFDVQSAVPHTVEFTVPSVKQFTEQFGICQKQIEIEKEKAPGSTIKVDTTEFLFIQKHNLHVQYRQFVVMFYDPMSASFPQDVSELYQIANQVQQIQFVICLVGVKELTRAHYTLAYNLPQMNIIADRTSKTLEKRHGQFYLVNQAGEIITSGSAIDKVPQIASHISGAKFQHRTDISGDKQFFLQGAVFNYLRRTLVKSLNNQVLFVFAQRQHEKFETFCQQIADLSLKYGDVTFIMFVQDLGRADLSQTLEKYKSLYCVNLAQDRNNVVKNILGKSNTGFYMIASCKDAKDKDKDKEITGDDTTKIEQLLQQIAAKPNPTKGDDVKLVLKTVKGDAEFRFIQKVYPRRGFSTNPLNNQRVCLCMVPEGKSYVYQKMVYYTYTQQVRYPELYFIICIQGLTKDNLEQYKERFTYLDKMNIVETNNPDALIRVCDQKDLEEDSDLEETFKEQKKVYTFKIFDGSLKEDVEVFGTPEDDIMSEFVVDKYSTKEHYKYLAPVLDPMPNHLGYKGMSMQYLNKPAAQKYEKTKPIIYTRIFQHDKIDTVLKEYFEFTKKNPNYYCVFSIENVNADNVKVFLQQKPISKNINIVSFPYFEEMPRDPKTQLQHTFFVTVQLPNADVYEDVHESLYGTQQYVVNQKLQMLSKFVQKSFDEYLQVVQQGEQDPVNLDVEPPRMPEDNEQEGDAKYEYYDKMQVTKSGVVLRYFQLQYLQKPAQFDVFLQMQRYCVVTVSTNSLFDPIMFEKKIKDIYNLQQENEQIGYMLIIENIFDEIQLYNLAQSAYYLNKLVVLQYKVGLNQCLRAAGEFVCFRNLQRETIFAKMNKFYYESTQTSSDRVVCKPIIHKNIPDLIPVIQKTNHNGVLELNEPNQDYVVLHGCLIKIVHRPVTPVQNQQKLFVLLKSENPAFIEQLSDKIRKTQCEVYVMCRGVTHENANSFVKKYDFAKNAYLLSDQNKQTARFCAYAQRMYGFQNDVMLMIKMNDNTVQKWTNKVEEIEFDGMEYIADQEINDDWWDEGDEKADQLNITLG
ncbi:Conserved_hypothetical protein [Hexamita inflata]|uniref:Uncharacterized protein n=1 Tax=Hexamita inflata TaxID=28002 RepID=A0AA86N4R2_9EUKA|nr:Conserved hypothetical protein [Hexamita inflata]